ncbi:MAG: ABC transporter ATP-binding protein [Flavobacteriales bacterium]|nr:ABC transporter ATP-binding protein [Flavobacteriales bacterium]
MIKAENLRKAYEGNVVLHVEDLTINKGEIVGLVGNNGAGKTTFFSMILDLIKADSGHVLSKDADVSKTEDWKMYTSAYLDDGFLINFLTPDEYFEFVGGLFNLSKNDVMDFVKQFEPIFNGEVIGQKKFIRQLSMGNRKKVGLIGALIGNPEIVLWDEPFSNLDPSTQIRVRNVVKDHSENRTFLVSSHDLHHIAEVCTRIIILDKGKVVRDVQNSPAMKEELFEFFEVE